MCMCNSNMPGKWHNYMEQQFPSNMREVKFYCSSHDSANICRKADILLSNNRTCEVQHSFISENEIVNRFNDWNKFGKEIIWFIDGNKGITIDKLSTGNYLLKFIETWKYKSFIKTYDYILVEKDDNVFKIELKKIKSGMIELKQSKSLKETIDFLTTKPDKIWDFWSDDNVVKSTLTVYQQGAGNGKTFGIWKSILENEDRKTYIIVTKQHSAKAVIKEELIDQINRHKNGDEIHHIENLTNTTTENTEKHYVFKYKHNKSNRECIVIIGTIDSFCYNLSDSNKTGSNYFEGFVNSIAINGATKVQNGYMKYGGQYIQLSKECEIWIDEVQDLPENYYYAMIKLMYETSCYVNVVGDKLQSLEFSENFMTNIATNGLHNINIVIKDPININRRIKVHNMANKINKLIHFDNYNLPVITCDENIPKNGNLNPIKIIKAPIIYANDEKSKIDNFCNTIIDDYKYRVSTYNYKPNDFHVIFPILKNNAIASELESRIQDFWVKKYDSEKYVQYVYFHKHTDGTVINTNDSIDATRIMSIKSSKGDGRKVTYILNVTEKSLKIVSNTNDINIVYESYLHVALTRAKEQIIFALIENNDDIHKRFMDSELTILPLPKITKNITLDVIHQYIDKSHLSDLFVKNNIKCLEIDNKIKPSEIVDWGYHCIKYKIFLFNLIYNIVKFKDLSRAQENSELFVKLGKISKIDICDYDVESFWSFLKNHDLKNLPVFPLCNYSFSKQSNNNDYQKYYQVIKNTMKKVQSHIKTNALNELNIYESFVLTYMIELFSRKNYSELSPLDLYNITHFFQTNSNKEAELLQSITNINNIITMSGITEIENIDWNIFRMISLDSKYTYFNVCKPSFPIIGNNDSTTIHIVLKTKLSHINFVDTMIEILLERILIYNARSDKDKKKFSNKKIETYIFLLDENDFIKIDWEWDKEHLSYIKNEIKCVFEKIFESNHLNIYKYFINKKNQNTEKWDQDPSIIIDNILEDIKIKYKGEYPEYIIDVFKDVNTKIQDEEDYSYIDAFETFNQKLNKKLDLYIKKYLDIPISKTIGKIDKNN